MKKVICVILAFCMMCSFAGCADFLGGSLFLIFAAANDDRADKETIAAFVCEQEDALLQGIENRDFSAFEQKGFIKDIAIDKGVVEFSCGGMGMGSATSYVGFYYTPDNDISAVWCAPSSPDLLTPSGKGFAWQEPNGDNRFYAEKICENFYYYEASF